MKSKVVLSLLCCVMFAGDALAWGPQAQQAISLAALQLIRERTTGVFVAGDLNYDADMIRGCLDGTVVLMDEMPLSNDSQTIDAISSQIQILREARARGAGSHFAYRMGVLSTLVSDVMIPYGFSFTESDRLIRERLIADIESNVTGYMFAPVKQQYHYVRAPRSYFGTKRSFYEDDKILIADDYNRGRGYRGFASEAGPTYFQRSVEAVADVWYTVFRPESHPADVKPSRRHMAQYYVHEIDYLLNVKGNFLYAGKAYDQFLSLNTEDMMTYVAIGDAYHEFGGLEGVARGVQEWQIAQRVPGAPRREASGRLSRHYIGEGERLFQKSEGPDSLETDLGDALEAFRLALGFDHKNDIALQRISETSIAIDERREAYETEQKFLENAQAVLQKAEQSRLKGDFSGAITSYNSALIMVSYVSSDFRDLYATSRERASEIRKELKGVVSEVLDAANESMELGDKAMETRDYDGAIVYFGRAVTIADNVPPDNSINDQNKKDLVETAQGQIAQAETQKKRLEQEQARAAQQNVSLGNN